MARIIALMERRGERPKPRGLLFGAFEEDVVTDLSSFFPTLWTADETPHPSEVDVTLLAPGSFSSGSLNPDQQAFLSRRHHIISFSESRYVELPGPLPRIRIRLGNPARTEGHLLPDLPLTLDRLRRAHLPQDLKTKSWQTVAVSPSRSRTLDARLRADAALRKTAILVSTDGSAPLAVWFVHPEGGQKGVAWLPAGAFRPAEWIRALCCLWAEEDPKAFPGILSWRESPEWMSLEERQLRASIETVEQERASFLTTSAKRIADLQADLAAAQERADGGLRRLLTNKGNLLADAVAEALEKLGFVVDSVDKRLKDEPKREDYRLKDADDPDWEAIVEVRGYPRSSGKTFDLIRLGRFAVHYEREKGRPPGQQLYVVNGPIELPPDQRDQPLAASPADVAEFAASDGAVISTLDLFSALRDLASTDRAKVRASIRAARGQWRPSRGIETQRGN